MSGSYTSLGPSQRNAVKLAVKHVNESGEYDYQLDPVYEDTQTTPGAAQQAAQRAIQRNDADLMFGAISSSVALSFNPLSKYEKGDASSTKGTPHPSLSMTLFWTSTSRLETPTRTHLIPIFCGLPIVANVMTTDVSDTERALFDQLGG